MTGTAGFAAQYEGTSALVLGADGFIGSWVCRALAGVGAQLTRCVRKRRDGSSGAGDLLQVDLLQPDCVADLIERVQPTVTFNLAGYGVDPSERDEHLAMQTNCGLLRPLVAALAKVSATGWPGQRLVHVGSALEYGEAVGDLSEDTAESPTTLYGSSKLAGTRTLAALSQELALPALTARLFTVYGPGEHPSRLLPALSTAARAGSTLDLSAGQQRRDFGYVEEIAQGLLRLGSVGASVGEVVNLATGRLVSVRNFAECAGRQLGMSPERLRFGALPTRAEEMAHDPVATGRLHERTGWLPELGIEEGIARALSFREDVREAN